MKCPVCIEKGMKSCVYAVYAGGGMTTAMYCEPYYDEDGVYHHHDLNTTTFSYRCSKGHTWRERSGGSCPCGWSNGDDKVEIMNREEAEEGIVTLGNIGAGTDGSNTTL